MHQAPSPPKPAASREGDRKCPHTETSRTSAGPLSIEDVRQFLYREARFLDDKEWDGWLALYAPDVEFWMPSWDDDDKLVTESAE